MEQQTLFGLPDYIAQPRRDHLGRFTDGPYKCEKSVRNHLLSGLSITVKECWILYKTSELRVIIARLRKEGMKILDRWFEGNGVRYKIYWLEKEVKL